MMWGAFVFHDTPVGTLDVDFPLGEEADVRVHAEGGTDVRFHIHEPPQPDRINHPFDASRASASDANCT